jgi:hypothetical protein
MKTKLLAILLLLTLHMAGQERNALVGHVTVDDAHAPGVFVINKNTGTEVKTDTKGAFTLPARNGDRLVVYSSKTVVREFTISAESFVNMPYELAVEPQAYELEEVVITDRISAQSLGLVPEGQKQLTVAERRVYTAAGDKPLWVYALGLLAGSMPVDPFINAISGRTKMLKKEVATEQNLAKLQSVSNLYTQEELTALLAIPAEKAQGFLFYAIEQPNMAQALAAGNDDLAKIVLLEVAPAYLALQTPQPEPANED